MVHPMIGLVIVLAVFLGIAAIGYLLDRRRRGSRTPEEKVDEAVWAAQHHGEDGPGTHEPPSLGVGPLP